MRVPLHGRERASHLQLRPRHAWSEEWDALDEPDAGRAVHALEEEIDARETIGSLADMQRSECLVIEFLE
jgi:hypothetical protein